MLLLLLLQCDGCLVLDTPTMVHYVQAHLELNAFAHGNNATHSVTRLWSITCDQSGCAYRSDVVVVQLSGML